MQNNLHFVCLEKKKIMKGFCFTVAVSTLVFWPGCKANDWTLLCGGYMSHLFWWSVFEKSTSDISFLLSKETGAHPRFGDGDGSNVSSPVCGMSHVLIVTAQHGLTSVHVADSVVAPRGWCAGLKFQSLAFFPTMVYGLNSECALSAIHWPSQKWDSFWHYHSLVPCGLCCQRRW
jgi:hypothetical protein